MLDKISLLTVAETVMVIPIIVPALYALVCGPLCVTLSHMAFDFQVSGFSGSLRFEVSKM